MDEKVQGCMPRIPHSCAGVPVYQLTQEHIDRHLAGSHARGKLVKKITMSDGKQAALVMFHSANPSKDEPDEPTPLVVCSCHFHDQVMDTDSNTSCTWMDDCVAKHELRDSSIGFTRYHYTTPEWETRTLGEKVMDIFTRVSLGEYLGQSQGDMVYVHEVSNFLGVSNAEVFNACQELFAEEKLDLSGMVLVKYHQRFRFPKELESLFAHVIQGQLVGTSGDTGDIFVHLLEQTINDHTHLKSGQLAFGDENFPHLAPHHLVSQGLHWLMLGIKGLQENPCEREKLHLSMLPHTLQGLVKNAKVLVAQQKKAIGK